MAKGIMDIGTNSVRLFIPNEMDLVTSEKFMRITRIGEGVDRSRVLSEEAMDRTLQGLAELKEIAIRRGVSELTALATSAVRDAANRDRFVERVQRELGISVEVISGEKEALLGFVGALRGLESPDGDFLIIDIGGGSTELIDARGGAIGKSHSFDIGVVRLTEAFDLSDPPRPDELQRMRATVRELVAGFVGDSPGKLLGIGGTVTTLAAVQLEMQHYDRQAVHGFVLGKDAVDALYARLVQMDNAARRHVAGLDEKRADVIVAGIVILQEIMELSNKTQVTVSDFDNLEGAYFLENG